MCDTGNKHSNGSVQIKVAEDDIAFKLAILKK